MAQLSSTIQQTYPEAGTQRYHVLRDELERIRRLFAAEPSILQVLVFGSVATRNVHAWSDLDLVVIAETNLSFLDRSLWLNNLVRPRVGAQFLVYRPCEIGALSRRNFVKREILLKGKVLSMDPQEDAKRWLGFAAEDLTMAELALDAGVFNQTCFHAQQCAEKCLKACVVAVGEITPRTHLITDLFEQLAPGDQGNLAELRDRVSALDQFYIPTRYPDALPGSLPEGLPTREHARSALETARLCFECVSSGLPR